GGDGGASGKAACHQHQHEAPGGSSHRGSGRYDVSLYLNVYTARRFLKLQETVGGPPPVHGQDLAGDEGGGGGGQEERRLRDLVGIAQPAHGRAPDELGGIEDAARDEATDELGLHVAGRDGVDADAPGGPLDGHHLGHHVQRGLGHAVGQALGHRDQAEDAADIDDGAAAAGQHPARDILAEDEVPVEVQVERVAVVGFRQ